MNKRTILKTIATTSGLDRVYWRHFKYRIGKTFNESNLVWHVLDAKNKKGVMIDVGVHYGESAGVYLVRGWEVFGFEPDRSNRKAEILGSIEKRFKRFHLYDYAVSDSDGDKVKFYTSKESTGISSIVSFHDSHQSIGEVETIRLDTFIGRNCIPKIDLLKIDTEGNDLAVLHGFPFDDYLPSIIECEFEDRKTKNKGISYKDIGDFLLSKGYLVYMSEWYPIKRYGAAHKWREIKLYPCKTKSPDSWGNFLAVSSEFNGKFLECLSGLYGIDIS